MTLDARFNLAGKLAVVVGGSGHLCSTLARAMVECAMDVIVLDVAEPVNGVGKYLRCDVASKADLVRCRTEIMGSIGRIDVLLNGAGTNAPTPFLEISAEEIERIIGVNLVGTIYGCQVFGEVMVAQRSGSIINFASASAGAARSKAFIYSTAKAGVLNIARNLAREWAPFNVRVNALRPGFFPTEWSMQHFIDEERKAKILGHTPMGRFGRPEELIGAVLWLASDAATFTTGAVIAVDGGFTAMTI